MSEGVRVGADTVVVFTGRGVDQMLAEGGSQAWALSIGRASRCSYIVCTQNRHNDENRTGTAPHRAAFLIAEISSIEVSPERLGRWIIKFDRYARIEIPDVWSGQRYPVNYIELADLGIDLSTLTFESINSRPEPAAATEFARTTVHVAGERQGVIDAAKASIATHLGVPVSAIEITIRA